MEVNSIQREKEGEAGVESYFCNCCSSWTTLILVSRNLLRQSPRQVSSSRSKVALVMFLVTHFLKHMSVNWVTDDWIFALADSCWMNANTS